MAETVAVLGGGVGGLTTAHELAERGFAVQVYERKDIFGGKARSIPVPNTGTEGRKDLPGEHGFRFFPSFYKHVPDTMSRIPYKGNKRGVLDNLVPASRSILARAGLPDLTVVSRFPRGREEWQITARAMMSFLRVVPPTDMLFYISRLMVWLTSSEERRTNEYEQLAWWEFTRAVGRSAAYQQFLGKGMTRMLVAIRAEEGSTRTVGGIGMQLGLGLMQRGVDVDRVLCGPTNEVWIDPWVEHLKKLGVGFHSNALVRQIHVADGRVTHVSMEVEGETSEVTADYYVSAMPAEVMAALLTPEIREAAPSMANVDKLRMAWMNGIQFFFADEVPVVHGHVIYADSPWALTSVSQRQFWRVNLEDYGDGQVHGILSVDISDWETPGLIYDRPANQCTAEEIKNEVWVQILTHLDGPTQRALVATRMLHWFLDPNITWPNPSETANAEPLLINTIGSWAYRPEAYTEIPNLFLAADYVRTNSDLACMEAANEAGRRAANALLRATGSKAVPAKVWQLSEPALFRKLRAWDGLLFERGMPHSPRRAMGVVLRRQLAEARRRRARGRRRHFKWEEADEQVC